MPPILVRTFAMDDYAEVYRLWATAGPGVALRPSDEPGEILKKLERDGDLFLVAEEAGQIVGVIMGAWDGRRGWLHHLAVTPAARRAGVATALVSTVEQRLIAKGCLKVNLLVRKDNLGAIELYARLGYQVMPAIIGMGKELAPDEE